MELSKSQLDRLGERLKAGEQQAEDIRDLDAYRKSFRFAYDDVLGALETLGLKATGRPAKTTTAIVQKLNRQSIRLTQIQDIAGLRVLVHDVVEQDRVVKRLQSTLSVAEVDDRRVQPSHGYRAVHVIVRLKDRNVEIQIRTQEQHRWAEWSEKLSDTVDPAIKYGGGPGELQDKLMTYSALVRNVEEGEQRNFLEAERLQVLMSVGHADTSDLRDAVEKLRDEVLFIQSLRGALAKKLSDLYNEVGQIQQ